ncbi:transglutaminase-like domain-containing protein [Clostridium oryzae]|uniref:Protein-glutamine gamma-glutamyltransferase n=1 Tax=Clostridium oryzae TaxID=1450648 RepID=A0A1V4ISG0_9CLOT|nr:transglutaminase-like domain-containing protein [Clostridium oryzae]OPJ62397.1 protein-glutamine gamma-glutamyltransferase [Clostridium oryzae]
MMKKRIIGSALIIVMLFSFIQFDNAYVTAKTLNSSSHYKLSKTGTYQLTTNIVLSSYYNTKFKMTYNIGKLSKSPYQKEISLKVYGSGAKLKKYSDGRRQLVISSTTKNGRAKYKIVRVYKNSAITYNKTLLSKASSSYKGFKDYKKYTSAESKIESNNSKIKSKAKGLFKGIKSPYKKAQKAFAFVNSYMTYGYTYQNKGALSALVHKSGVCEDYAELFIALLRAAGVPARIVTGYRINPQYFSNKTVKNAEYYSHAWPEFYLPKYGWIVVEPTFTYLYNGKKTVDYNFFAKLSSPNHFISGYSAAGNDMVSLMRYSAQYSMNHSITTSITKK